MLDGSPRLLETISSCWVNKLSLLGSRSNSNTLAVVNLLIMRYGSPVLRFSLSLMLWHASSSRQDLEVMGRRNPNPQWSFKGTLVPIHLNNSLAMVAIFFLESSLNIMAYIMASIPHSYLETLILTKSRIYQPPGCWHRLAALAPS